jgi:hypothetical protein
MTDTVANAAIRNGPNDFKAPPQPLEMSFFVTSFNSTTCCGGDA